jgi:hypothetical protein
MAAYHDRVANPDLTKAILAEVQAQLKPLGFRKTGSTFTRDRGAVVQIANIQKSTTSDSTHIKVTVNLALWVKALAPIRAGVPDKEDVWSAHWRVRIGEVGPERKDVWWSAASKAEAEFVGRQLAARLITFGLPQMEELSSPAALICLWQTGVGPGLTGVERERYLKKLLGPAA